MSGAPADTREFLPRVRGHAAAKRALYSALTGGRLRGSFLLTGEPGIGRALLARELARALNCRGEDPTAPLPCEACGPCRRILHGSFGDYVVVAPAEDSRSGDVTIDQVRDMLRELFLAPVEGKQRVFVIDPASALNESSQQALLKGLEEPPGSATLILIATSEDELLPTIASRCQVLALPPLSAEDVAGVVLEHAAAAAEGGDDQGEGEGAPQLTPEDAERRAAWSGGSPGRALSDEAPALVQAVEDFLDGLIDGRIFKDPMGAVEALKGFVESGDKELRFRRLRLLALGRCLGWALRDALVRRAGGTTVPQLSGAGAAQLEALAGLPEGRLEQSLERLSRLEEETLQNVNPTLVLEGLVLDLGSALAPGDPRR